MVRLVLYSKYSNIRTMYKRDSLNENLIYSQKNAYLEKRTIRISNIMHATRKITLLKLYVILFHRV